MVVSSTGLIGNIYPDMVRGVFQIGTVRYNWLISPPRQNIVFVYATCILLVVLQSTPYW